MGKLLLWTITLIGLVPSAYVAIVASCLLDMLQRSPAFARYRNFPIHDTYISFGVGSMNVTVFPCVWAIVLIMVGIGCVILGLLFLLHIPVEKS